MHRFRSSTTWVSKATIAEEVRDGHDFLWALRSVDRRRWLHLRVQAKILFPSGQYEGLGTTKDGNDKADDQAAALLRAKGNGQVPVYAFYNGSALPFGTEGHVGAHLGCGRSHPRKFGECFACDIATCHQFGGRRLGAFTHKAQARGDYSEVGYHRIRHQSGSGALGVHHLPDDYPLVQRLAAEGIPTWPSAASVTQSGKWTWAWAWAWASSWGERHAAGLG